MNTSPNFTVDYKRFLSCLLPLWSWATAAGQQASGPSLVPAGCASYAHSCTIYTCYNNYSYNYRCNKINIKYGRTEHDQDILGFMWWVYWYDDTHSPSVESGAHKRNKRHKRNSFYSFYALLVEFNLAVHSQICLLNTSVSSINLVVYWLIDPVLLLIELVMFSFCIYPIYIEELTKITNYWAKWLNFL